ncbi:MAG: TRAP transporter large permease subunit [Deltaproteobacteria bacterium]|nr:TRAP transporter large permease subunit [Deltaproteobacteria bacterium]
MDMIILLVFLLLVLISVPIGLALFLAAVFGFMYFADLPLIMMGQAMFLKLDKFSLLCVLFFVLAGNLMTRGAIARKIVEFAEALVGHLKSGLPIASITSCALFGAVSGSALATLSAIGGLMVPALRKQKFSNSFSVGLLTSSSILGIIVPPSIPMIIYCLVADVSIAKLFMAGFLPAIVLVILLSIYAVFRSNKESIGKHGKFSSRTLWRTFGTGVWALFMPVIIFGGIFSGMFTATEAAVVAAVYAYLVEFFVYRELSLKEIYRITVDSGLMVATILIITAGSMVMSDYLTIMEIPDRITTWITGIVDTKVFYLLIVNIMLLVVGTFMEVIAAILIMAPILLPVAVALGVDPVHFGIIMCLNLGIGYITPPVGVNCFLASGIFKIPVVNVFRYVAPTLIVLMIALVFITYIPGISMLLPNYFLG